MHNNNHTNNLYGTIFMIIHCMSYSAHIALVKILQVKFDVFQMLFIQSALNLLFVIFYILYSKQKTLGIIRTKLHIIRAILVLIEFFKCFFMHVKLHQLAI